MNRFLNYVIGAGLAVLMTGAAQADTFTVARTVDQSTITNGGAGGSISVTFTGLGTPTPEAESNPPGTSMVLLNYRVTSSGPAEPIADVTFNDNFVLSLLFTDTSYATNNTHTSVFNGHISGTANAYQDNLVISLTPANPDSMVFDINYTRFTLSNLMASAPPAVNAGDLGAISARIVSAPVPEPGSMALLGAGLLPALGILRRRR